MSKLQTFQKVPAPLLTMDGVLRPVQDEFTSDKGAIQVVRKTGSTIYSTDSSKITIRDVSLSASDAKFLQTDNTVIEVPFEKSMTGPVKRVWLEFTVTQTATQSYLLPVPYWFKTIELVVKGSSGDPIKTFYPEELLLNIALLDISEREYVKSEMNFGKNSWLSAAKLQQPAASATVKFRMPILHNPIELCNLNMKSSQNDLIFRLKSRAALENQTGAPTLDAIKVISEEYDLSEASYAAIKQLYSSQSVAGDFLDFQKISYVQTLTSGTETRLDLKPVNNSFSPFILIAFRALSSPDTQVNDKNLNTYSSLGPNAIVDFRSNGLLSIFDQTKSLTQNQLRTINQRILGNSDLLSKVPFYILPFSKHIQSALKSASWAGGCMKFDGTNADIRIIPYSGTACVQVLNVGGTPASGSYYFVYKGQYSELVAYNATAAVMKAAFENIPQAKADGLVVTFNEALSADGSITATFDVANGDVDLVEIVPYSLATSAPAFLPGTHGTYTVRGVAGITSAASYVADIYVAQFKQLIQLPDGNFNRSTIMP